MKRLLESLDEIIDGLKQIKNDDRFIFTPAQMREANFAIGLPRNMDEDLVGHCRTCGADMKTLDEMRRHDAGHSVAGRGLYSLMSFWSALPDGELKRVFWQGLFAGQDEEYVKKARARIAELAGEFGPGTPGVEGAR